MREKGTLGQTRRKGKSRTKRPISAIKKGISIIQDVHNLLLTEGIGILAIPNKLDIEIKQVLQHCKQDGHDQSDSVDNVQILERMVREGKNQMITLAEGGMVKLQQCVNQAERLKAKENGMHFWGILGDVCRIILLRKCKK